MHPIAIYARGVYHAPDTEAGIWRIGIHRPGRATVGSGCGRLDTRTPAEGAGCGQLRRLAGLTTRGGRRCFVGATLVWPSVVFVHA